MANSPDHYMKLLVGELTAQIAILRAENETLREQLTAQTNGAKKPKPLKVAG